MSKTLEKGYFYEQLAKAFLEQQGYTILVQNYRFGKGEIDLIAQKDDWLVFVEVRYRKDVRFGFPEQTVSAHKKQLLCQAAENFIFEQNWQKNIRFDIIAISSDKKIEHFEDCF